MNIIRKFINDNNLSFAEGSRNTSCTTIIGYALYLDMTKAELEKELKSEIKVDVFIKDEIDRLWSYCKSNNYERYWNTITAKNQYTF